MLHRQIGGNMSFKLPDLIVESIIRDGLNNARRDESVIEDVFADLNVSYTSKKYGASEIEKIKEVIRNKEVSIVHAFNLVNANLPCISITMADDTEDEKAAQLGGYVHNVTQAFTTPEQLAKLVIVGSFQPTSYDPKTGIVKVPDSVNLSSVYPNLLFVDSSGAKHAIKGGIINDPGAKQFIIGEQAEVDLGGGAEIKSSIDYEIFQKRGNAERTQIILGVHTQDALLTKYLYVLVKYFILSRRTDMVRRGFQLSTYQGSDFSRDVEYGADVVFTRFFHLTGLVMHQWRSDKVQLIDSVDVQVQVAKDRLGNEALDLQDSTIKVRE
jgi:hypothetical protein